MKRAFIDLTPTFFETHRKFCLVVLFKEDLDD
jgi:hypothetical protein